VADFEFGYGTGESSEGPPVPDCGCAIELISGEEYRVWLRGEKLSEPPWPNDDDTLVVAYNSTAEMRCFHALRWKPPRHLLDLFAEYRQIRNGTLKVDPDTNKLEKTRLIEAIKWCRDNPNNPPICNPYPCPNLEEKEKEGWQQRFIRGDDFTPEEKIGGLEYCMHDVLATRWLLLELAPRLPHNLSRALYRGRYMTAAAASMMIGFPVDEPLWNRLLDRREDIMRRVIDGHPAYTDISFNEKQYREWLEKLHRERKIQDWIFTPTGKAAYSDKVLKRYDLVPEISQFRHIRDLTLLLEEPKFEVRNGRHYYKLIPFTTKTSRNTTNQCLTQAPAVLRGFIRPLEGRCLIISDFAQQEYYITAVLSGDPEMLRLYREGDPYVSFARSVGLMPPTGDKHSHSRERKIAKEVCLAVIYGMGIAGLARKMNISYRQAEELFWAHKRQFPVVWNWVRERVACAKLQKRITNACGWYMAVTDQTSIPTLQNYSVQSLAADILRFSHIALYENNLCVCGPIHDAFAVETAIEDAEKTAIKVRELMEAAGRHVLGADTILRAETEVILYPDRWLDRGRDGGEVGEMWDRIWGALQTSPEGVFQ
jgi:hypothetical protein